MRSAGKNPNLSQLKAYIDERANPAIGYIGFEEFKEMCERQTGNEDCTPAERKMLIDGIKFALRAFDREGTGFIDRNELKGGILCTIVSRKLIDLLVLVRVGDALDGKEVDELLRLFGSVNSKNQVPYESTIIMRSVHLLI